MHWDKVVPHQAQHFGGSYEKNEFRPFLRGVWSKMKRSGRQTIRILLFWLLVGGVEDEEKNEYFLEGTKIQKK